MMILNASRVSMAVLLGIWLVEAPVEARKWTDNTRRFSVEAEYTAFQRGEVVLKKNNGEMILVPLNRLSETDREYVKTQRNAPRRIEVSSQVPQLLADLGKKDTEIRSRAFAALWGLAADPRAAGLDGLKAILETEMPYTSTTDWTDAKSGGIKLDFSGEIQLLETPATEPFVVDVVFFPYFMGVKFGEGSERLVIQRVHAIEWLGEFDEDPKEVIAVLKNAHKDESVLVKLAAAVALGKLGVGVEGVDTTLIAALKDKELPNGIRYLACIGLEHLGARGVDAVPVLERSLTDDDSVELLPDELRPDDGDVEESDGLDAFAPTVGHAAALALGKMGPAGKAVLTRAMRHENPSVVSNATEAMGNMDPVPVGELIAALQSDNWRNNVAAVRAFRKAGPRAVNAKPGLIELLAHKDFGVRIGADRALKSIGSMSRKDVPRLLDAYRARPASYQIINFLVETKASAEVISALEEESNAAVRAGLLETLAQFGDDETLALVIGGLDDESPLVRRSALESLAGFGPGDKSRREAVVKRLGDEDERIAILAAAVLGQWGEVDDGVPLLKRVLKGSDVQKRRMALSVLGRIGSKAKDALSDVEAALGDQDIGIRLQAAGALGRMGETSKAIRAMQTVAEEGPPNVRKQVVSALRRLGPEAAVALDELSDDDDPGVRRVAARALKEFSNPFLSKPKDTDTDDGDE